MRLRGIHPSLRVVMMGNEQALPSHELVHLQLISGSTDTFVDDDDVPGIQNSICQLSCSIPLLRSPPERAVLLAVSPVPFDLTSWSLFNQSVLSVDYRNHGSPTGTKVGQFEDRIQ